MAGRVYVGTSGWNYKHWAKGVFYPQGLKQSEWLRFYCQQFQSVEVNNTFYHLPARHVFEQWQAATPENFMFAVKASRFITHMKKLLHPEEHVAKFLENASGLRQKLGVVLFQLPPFLKFHTERLEALVDFVQRQRIIPGLRSALEIRHQSWNCEACFRMLRKYGVSLALTDWSGFTTEGPVTAEFIFIRRHGPGDLYASNYPDSHLRRDARRIRAWLSEAKDVYIYFNNDAFGYAVKNARRIQELLAR